MAAMEVMVVALESPFMTTSLVIGIVIDCIVSPNNYANMSLILGAYNEQLSK